MKICFLVTQQECWPPVPERAAVRLLLDVLVFNKDNLFETFPEENFIFCHSAAKWLLCVKIWKQQIHCFLQSHSNKHDSFFFFQCVYYIYLFKWNLYLLMSFFITFMEKWIYRDHILHLINFSSWLWQEQYQSCIHSMNCVHDGKGWNVNGR